MQAPERPEGDYVIEHRGPHGKTVLFRRVVLLAPLAAQLEAAGHGGELVVLDARTGELRIRWRLAPARPALRRHPPP